MTTQAQNILYVFSTQRLILDFYSKQPQGLMPKALSIGEFFKKSYIIPQKTRISHRIQAIILQEILREIIKQKPKITNLFVFEKSFLGYLEGSDFLLYLFNEIKSHNIAFGDIPKSDIYADFSEHLAIIEEIFYRFEAVLEKEGFFSIPHKNEIVIIDEFVQSFEKIMLFIEGFLTPLEVHILEQIAQKTPLQIYLNIDSYNATHFPYLSKMLESNTASKNAKSSQDKLESGFGYCIEMRESKIDLGLRDFGQDTKNTLDFRQNLASQNPNSQNLACQTSTCQNLVCKIASKSPLPPLPPISAFGFELRIGQCAFVLEKVRELLERGVDGEQIAIVVPSEDIIEFFDLLDEARNLNYAMGRENLGFFAKIESLINEPNATQNNPQNPPSNATQDNLSKLESILESSKIYAQISPNLAKSIQEILLQYAQIKSHINALEWQEVATLFLEDLKQLRQDDTRGGKVRVMGILETRGLSFEYVFVLDCNASFIPKVKDSDMFLNTFIRTQLSMPTLKDREHLQKHYYYSLFWHTRKEIYLTHTQNDETTRASLLEELNIKSQNGDDFYALFPSQNLPFFADEKAFGSLENFRFSATSLWTFFECKRKFYFQYVLKIAQQEEENLSLKIGNNLHNALFYAYSTHKNTPLNLQILEQIKQDFMTKSKQIFEAQNANEISYMENLAYQINALEMRGFWECEKKRVQKNLTNLENGGNIDFGFSNARGALCVLECECEIESSILHNGKTFALKGRIDRLDLDAQGRIWILDYKYAKNQSSQKYKFQLAFYKLLLESKILEYGNLGFLGKEYEIYALRSDLGAQKTQDFDLCDFVKADLYFLREKENASLVQKNAGKDLDKNPSKSPSADKMRESILQTLEESLGQNNQVDFAPTQKLSTCRNCPYIWLCNRA